MKIIDNINQRFGDDLKRTIKPDSKLQIAASCFSIYAYEALKTELEQADSVQFIFTSPTFVPDQVTDKVRKEKREFHIPKVQREVDLGGTEFEIRLKNELKCTSALEEQLRVTKLTYTVERGEQDGMITYDGVKGGDSFVVKENRAQSVLII